MDFAKRVDGSEVQVFCDFDGTVALQDIGNSFLTEFGLPDWLEAEREFLAGTLGSRDALVRQYRALDATPETLRRFVQEKVELDPTFPAFLEEAKRREMEVSILSDGLDLYINEFLRRYGLEHLPLYCNKGRWVDRHIEVEFPYYNRVCGVCGNCKTSHLNRERRPGQKLVYVGDGWSDRCPARNADVVFAKDRLRHFCEEQGIAFRPFAHFDDVGRALFGK